MKKIFYLFLLTFFSANYLQAQVESDSVVLYLPLDGNFADSSGNNHPLSRVFGDAFTYEDGVMGQSIQFNKNVFVTDDESLLNTFNDHTFAVWVNLDTIPTEAGEAMTFIHQTDVGPNPGRIHVECRNPNNDFSSLTGNKRVSGGSVVDSTWIHVASVVDVTAGRHYLYVDGEQVASIAKGTENNFGQFVFGSFKDRSKFYARGNMDEMLLTKEVLDATQLKQIMKYGVKVAKDSLVLVTGVTLNTTADGDSVELGKTLQINALVDPNDAYDTTLTWSVDYDTIATIDENGLLTAVNPGTVIVTATTNDFSGVSQSITIKVFKYPVEDITLSVTPNDTISLSGSAIVSALVAPDTASSKLIIWGVDDESVATVASETDTSATLTPKQIGNVRVYAMASDGSMIVDSIDMVITGIKVTDIALSVAGDTTVLVGESLQILASVDPANAADTTLAWHVDNESIATIDAGTGLLTGISVGAVTVKATAKDGSGVVDSIEIAVLPVLVDSIHLTAPNDSVAAGGNITISAEVLPDTATIKMVDWSLINDVTGSSVLNGVLTAGTEGTVWVKATARDGSNVADSLSFVIYQPVLVDSIHLSASDNKVIAGQDITIMAEVFPDTAENKEVTWSLINDVTGSSIFNGVLTAGTPGTVWVKATANDGSNVADSLSINVYNLDTVFHFAFDGNLNDVSGSNVQITTPKGTGFFTTDSTGVNGKAIAFDGVTDHNYLQINQLNLLDPSSTDFTACAWVKITSDVSHIATHVLLHQTEPATTPKGTGATRWILGVEGSGPNGSDTLRVGSWIGGGITTSNGIVPRNEWVHIAVVGTTSNDKLKYFINGEFSSEETPPNAFEASNKGFIIGNHRAGSNAGAVWDGLVDDLYLLRKAVTASELRVIAGIDTEVKVDSINLTAPNDSVAAGGNITITVNVFPDTATNKAVTWSLINDTTGSSIDNGILTAGSEGTVWVKATAEDGSGVVDSLMIKVYEVPVANIVLGTPNNLDSVLVGQSLQILVGVLPENATEDSVLFSVDNNSIATIDDSGVITGLSAGTVTVTATAYDGSEISETIQIKIYETVGLNALTVRSLVIKPNPSNGQIQVILPESTIENAPYMIYSISGYKMAEGLVSNNGTLVLDELSTGVYYMMIEDNRTVYREKLIIE